MEKDSYVEFTKIDQELGLILGFAIVCKEHGQDYYDLQGDHIPEDSMLIASADFMAKSREARTMHGDEVTGTVVFAFPLTTEICKAFGMTTERTGLMIGMKPADASVLEKFRSGEFTGFSIGGLRGEDENVDD